MKAPGSSSDGLGEEISGLRAEFARIREDLDRLSGRISTAVDDALAGVYRLKTVDDRMDALFACAAEFARTSKDPSGREHARAGGSPGT